MMTFVPQRSFVLKSGASPEEACAQLRRLLDAPKPACGYCGSGLPAGIHQYCVACGHDLPGRFRLEGTVSPENFCVSLDTVTYGILVFRRPPALRISGCFQAAPGGTGIPVSIRLSLWEYVLCIPALGMLLAGLIYETGVMALPFFILLLLMFQGILIVHFRPDANKAQEILTNLWSRRVSEMTPQRPPANTR